MRSGHGKAVASGGVRQGSFEKVCSFMSEGGHTQSLSRQKLVKERTRWLVTIAGVTSTGSLCTMLRRGSPKALKVVKSQLFSL